MGAKENAELVKRAYAAFDEGDREAVGELFAPDIEWRVPGESRAATVDHGMEEVFEGFERIMELTGGTYDHEVIDCLGGEDHAIALVRVTAERDGRTLDTREVVVFRVEDGRLHDAHHVPFDLYEWDEFFS